jgi:hypothetical protein
MGSGSSPLVPACYRAVFESFETRFLAYHHCQASGFRRFPTQAAATVRSSQLYHDALDLDVRGNEDSRAATSMSFFAASPCYRGGH